MLVYSSSRLVTLCLLERDGFGVRNSRGGKVTERLVRAHRIVDAFPSPEIAIEGGELKRARDDLIELLGMPSLRPFQVSIEFGGAGRQHEQAQAALLAGPFELGGELAASIDLDGLNRKRYPLPELAEKRGGGGWPWRGYRPRPRPSERPGPFP